MLTEICANIRNYFTKDSDKHFGTFTISGGSIEPLDFLKKGQYFRIVGSSMNDGVYQFPVTANMADEVFDGAVWAMSVPPALVALAEKIEEEEEKQAKDMADGGWDLFQSQSFAGYSGTVKSDTSWQTRHRNELNRWRKI